MSSKIEKHAKLQNALSLFTLLFLLGIISFTLSQATQRQTTKSRGQVQEGIIGGVSPTYWIGEDPNAPRPTALQEPTAPAPTEELLIPTIYCLGGVPCTSPEPTNQPIESPAPTIQPENTKAPEPTKEEPDPTVQEPAPTNDPCVIEDGDNTASIQTYPHKKHRKHHDHGNHYGWFSQLFRALLDFLEELLRRLGMDNPKIDPNPSQPTQPNPCITIVPTQQPAPTEVPGENPTQGPEPTAFVPTNMPVNPTALPTQVPSEGGGGGTNGGTTGGETRNVKITFYGSYDNDPKGSLAISSPVLHQQAGGIGTYEDPLTFASPAGAGAYEVGQKIYVPLVQKYFIKEDECAVSWTAPNGCGAVTMVDLYVGNPSSDVAVVECENSITPSGDSQIILNPPSNLTYDPTPIWNQNTKTCMTPHN